MEVEVMVRHGVCLVVPCGPLVRKGLIGQSTNLNGITEDVGLVHSEVQDNRTVAAIDGWHGIAILSCRTQGIYIGSVSTIRLMPSMEPKIGQLAV